MDRVSALTLAGKIESTWFERSWPQAKSAEWIDALETLDEGAAGTAFARLRAAGGQTITIAQFISATKAVQPHDGGNRPGHQRCPACDDSGWVEAPDRIEPGPIVDGERSEIRYSQQQPCRCPEGRRRADSAVWRENHLPRATAA